jgi:hypothetical protein
LVHHFYFFPSQEDKTLALPCSIKKDNHFISFFSQTKARSISQNLDLYHTRRFVLLFLGILSFYLNILLGFSSQYVRIMVKKVFGITRDASILAKANSINNSKRKNMGNNSNKKKKNTPLFTLACFASAIQCIKTG